jgi:hypothetical protein
MARILATFFGLIAGIVSFLFLYSTWERASSLVDLIGLTGIAAALSDSAARLIWAICIAVTLFSLVALAVLVMAGIEETLRVRRRLNALRNDPSIDSEWSARGWRGAFAGSAVASYAGAVAAEVSPLLAIEETWLNRLSLARIFGWLPALLLGLSASSALIGQSREPAAAWSIFLAAGASGAFVIALAFYLARAILAPLVANALSAAACALGQVSVSPPPSPKEEAAGPRIDYAVLATAIAEALSEPVETLREAADQIRARAEPDQRDQSIESTLAEVRAGIERLLGPGQDKPAQDKGR